MMTNRRDSLDHLFTPRTVAVVGASRDERKKGNLVVRNLSQGYAGEVFPVHPTARRVAGLKAYRSLGDIPTEIDLLIPLIPAHNLLELLRGCPPDRVNVLLAIPAGFGEAPPDGPVMERALVATARSKGMRILGPNSLGIINCGIGLNASLAPELPGGAGELSVVTQSGGFGMSIYMYGIDHQLDIAKFCDLGNTSDISIAEVLKYYTDDPTTTIMGAFLESHPPGVATSIAEAADTKPLILTAIGRTNAGRRATLAHLGPTPGGHRVVPPSDNPPIIAQTGLEMLDIAKAMIWQPLPSGVRVGIITGSGGIGAELVDLCVEHGLEVPQLSDSLRERLQPHLPPFAGVANPVDLTPAWPDYPEMYPPLMETLLESDEIDLLIITVIDMATVSAELMEAITEAAQKHTTESDRPKPVLTYWMAPPGFRHRRQTLQASRVPCYSSTLSTVRVAAAITEYARPSFRVPD
jgi:acetyltransferase